MTMVTDEVGEFTETGVRLASGPELEADVVVAATGLDMLALGGMGLGRRRPRGQPARAPRLQGDDARGRAQSAPSRSATRTPHGR